jgi:hypothetical protein
MNAIRGNKREFGGYLESRGWHDAGVQRVVRKWKPKLAKEHFEKMSSKISAENPDRQPDLEKLNVEATEAASETIEKNFRILRRCFEYREKVMLEIEGQLNCVWYFVVDMIQALDDLFDPENTAGWVVKMCGESKPVPKKLIKCFRDSEGNLHQKTIAVQDLRPLTFKEMAAAIADLGGPRFEVKSLEKAAERLKLARVKSDVNPSKKSRSQKNLANVKSRIALC